MRIAIDIRGLASPKQSGVGEYTLELLRALFKIAPEHDFVLFSIGTEAARRHVLDNLNLIDIEKHRTHVRHIHHLAPNKSTNLKIAARDEPVLDKIIRNESDSCDVLFFPNLNFISVSNTPMVVTVHDMSWNIFPHFFTTKDQAWHRTLRPQKILTEAKTVIAPSESTKQDIENELDIEGSKIQVVPHGIRYDLFNPETQSTDHGIRSQYKLKGRYLLLMATIEPRKNIHALLDAWDEYSKTDPELQLVIVGGPGWRSKDIIERFNSIDRVRYLGYIPNDHRPALVHRSVAFPIASSTRLLKLFPNEGPICDLNSIAASNLPSNTTNKSQAFIGRK